jgi:AraC-like DNA-binding protein
MLRGTTQSTTTISMDAFLSGTFSTPFTSPWQDILRFVENIPHVALYVRNHERRLIYCNSVLAIVCGKKPNDILGMREDEVFSADLLRRLRVAEDRLDARNEAGTAEIYWPNRQGVPVRSMVQRIVVKNSAYLTTTLLLLAPLESSGEGSPIAETRMEKVIERLRRDLGRFPPLAELAEVFNVSTRQFQRQFSELTGMSPRMYWIRLRIQEAITLLVRGESIGSASTRAGYASQSNFSIQFRKEMGMTPTQYVKLYRQGRLRGER